MYILEGLMLVQHLDNFLCNVQRDEYKINLLVMLGVYEDAHVGIEEIFLTVTKQGLRHLSINVSAYTYVHMYNMRQKKFPVWLVPFNCPFVIPFIYL